MDSIVHEFTYPPKDGSLPLGLAVDFHLKYNPNETFAVLYDTKTSSQTGVTYLELAYAVHRVAHMLNAHISGDNGKNVGIMISVDSLSYIALVLGTIRAGLTPFPISPRVQPADIAQLLAQTETQHALIGGSPTLSEIGKAVQSTLQDIKHAVEFISLPASADLFPRVHHSATSTDDFKLFNELKDVKPESPLWILHSSGSARTPTPVTWTQEGAFKNFASQPITHTYASPPRARVCVAALPTFHTMGLMMQCVSPLFLGTVPVLFAHSNPVVMPTSDLTLQAVVGTGPHAIIAAPAFLETWSQDENAIGYLKRLNSVTYGGGPLAIPVGNKLAESGIRLLCGYGSTELGAIIRPFDSTWDIHDWPYVSFASNVNVKFQKQDGDDGSYELVVLPGPEYKPFVLDSTYEGNPAYRTNDLVLPHPSKAGLWKFVGRTDDQIVLLNGEKVNPGSMEAEIVLSPLVDSVIIFGRERNNTGALIELSANAKKIYSSSDGRERLIEEIWPYIERANKTSSTQARLAGDTIILVDPSRSLPRTPKGTVARSKALRAYAEEIDRMYAALEKGTSLGTTVGLPKLWNDPKLVKEWLSSYVSGLLGKDVPVNADLFQYGMDSLTATILLRTINSALNASDNAVMRNLVEKMTQPIVFANPSIDQLAKFFVDQSINPNKPTNADVYASTLQAIRTMIDKYNSGWESPARQLQAQSRPPKERVVLTGTTGALGSYLLAQLLANENVGKVWALNRASEGLAERQRASFEDKSLDVELLKSTKLSLLQADLTDEKLGLAEEILRDIRSSVTIFIHNAWPVNFNLNLQSFESSIRGTRNLLELASSATTTTGSPRFLFTSSISAAGLGKPNIRLMETTIRAEDAAHGIGYGQSKFVAERLLKSARMIGVEACVIRLGQLTGDHISGSWSVTDWVPSIVASSVSAGYLPMLKGRVSWIPLDVAARSIIDICIGLDIILPPVIHVSHPRPVEWSRLFSNFAQILGARGNSGRPLPITSFTQWNRRIGDMISNFRGSEEDLHRRFPTTKIQVTIDAMAASDEKILDRETHDVEAGPTMLLDVSEGQRQSETLRNVLELDTTHVEKWVEYWEHKGLFN